jgi:hypothetical protein
MMRIPTFHTVPPAPAEVRKVLWKSPAAVVSYILKPDKDHPPNAWLYVCADHSYALDKLPHAMRKNVRRGLKEFKIEPMSGDQLLLHGAKSFCDSRRRNGLSDGTEAEFHRRFGTRVRSPGRIILGAWRDDTLAAFLFTTIVDDWTENEGPFGADACLSLRPNDALLFWELSHYLTEGTCRLVSAGLSSIQADSNEKGLHEFKLKVGFEAQPVHRVFVLHPILKRLAAPLTLWGVQTLLRFRPRDRRLRKAGGLLKFVLGKTPALDGADGSCHTN